MQVKITYSVLTANIDFDRLLKLLLPGLFTNTLKNVHGRERGILPLFFCYLQEKKIRTKQTEARGGDKEIVLKIISVLL